MFQRRSRWTARVKRPYSICPPVAMISAIRITHPARYAGRIKSFKLERLTKRQDITSCFYVFGYLRSEIKKKKKQNKSKICPNLILEKIGTGTVTIAYK